MSTFAERFIQRGEARILICLLKRKFGGLPEAIRWRIEAAYANTHRLILTPIDGFCFAHPHRR